MSEATGRLSFFLGITRHKMYILISSIEEVTVSLFSVSPMINGLLIKVKFFKY